MAYVIKSRPLTGILDQALDLVRNHLKLLTAITGAIFIPVAIVQQVIVNQLVVPLGATSNARLQALAEQRFTSRIFIAIELILVIPLTHAALTHAIFNICVGRTSSAWDSILFTLRRFGAVVWANFIMLLVLTLGLLALIFPFFYLNLKYSFVPATVVLEDQRGARALQRSGTLMQDNYGTAAVLWLLLMTVQIVVLLAFQRIQVTPVRIAAIVMFRTATVIVSASVWMFFYFSCRCKLENYDLSLLADSVATALPPQPVVMDN
jgi:hypothetical protein